MTICSHGAVEVSHVRVHQQKSGSNIKPILIAGGFTSRIGSPKHFLPNTDGRLLYQHTFEELNQALPHVTTVYILLRNESKFSDTHALHAKAPSLHLEPLYDTISISIGPAAALLAAHTHSPTITWLVVACDHLLLTAEALQQLFKPYILSLTCFDNAQGFVEPLLGI